jgi:hypothetical protein
MMPGYWDRSCHDIYCTIDSNDRFEFYDQNDEEYWKNQSKPTQEVLDHLSKGVDFHVCNYDGFNYMFLKHGSDGVYYNGRMVFSSDELKSFNKREEVDDDTGIDKGKWCSCPRCSDAEDWFKTFPKYIHLYVFVTEEKYREENVQDGIQVLVKEDGIEFMEGNEIIHVGRQGAHVHLLIPL